MTDEKQRERAWRIAIESLQVRAGFMLQPPSKREAEDALEQLSVCIPVPRDEYKRMWACMQMTLSAFAAEMEKEES